MEMRVSCRTPVLPRIGFGADLTRRKRRARRSNTLPRQLTRLLRAARQLLFGFTWSIQRKKYTPPTSTTRFAATSSWGMRRACVMPAQARSDRCGIVSDDVAICANVQTGTSRGGGSQEDIKHANALNKTNKTPKNSLPQKNTKKHAAGERGTERHIGISACPIWAGTTPILPI